MMKSIPIIFALFFCLGEVSFAHDENAQLPKGKPEEVLSLKDGLSRISSVFDIKFTYERVVVEKINIQFDWESIKTKNATEVLDAILLPNGLSYKLVSKNYYIITKKKEAEILAEKSTGIPANALLISDRMIILDTVIGPTSDKKGTGIFKGKVMEKETGKPVIAATIQLVEYGLYTLTNGEGEFIFNDVPSGKVSLNIQHVSMLNYNNNYEVQSGKITYVNIALVENAFSLREVQVVAKEGKSGQATSSLISKTAIEHIQATSLGDVLQLLPGAVVSNPDFAGPNKVSLRQVGADNLGSMGTSIIVNGAPISNNANLQVSNVSTGGANAAFSTTAGAGMDLRQFSADNIEAVEVIRGIPSVEYGDLTSGAILVKTKAGKEPLNIKARINPKLTQFWAGKGFDLGQNNGSIFMDVDYTSAVDDQRYRFRGYDRLTGNILYSKKFLQNLYTTTGLGYSMNVDDEKTDPDDTRTMAKRKAQDYAYRFNTSGRLSLNRKFARNINYDVAVNYSVQKGFQQQLLSGYIYPLSTSMKDTMMQGEYVPSEYISQLRVEGKPLNIYAKLNNQFFIKTGQFNHNFLVGTDWKTDANFGEGKIYDLSRPPSMAGGNAARPISYKDIPALNQFALYAQDMITAQVFNRNLAVQAGVRFDNVQPTGPFSSKVGTGFSPRINFSYEAFRNFDIRLGYGITSKAPSLLYLYPQASYYDLLNFNYYPTNPAERLVMITTKVFDIENQDLKIMKNTKKEIGFDWNFMKGKRLTVTGFHERTKNGYNISTSFNTVKMVPLPKYEVGSYNPGSQPTLNPIPIAIDTFIADYMGPNNNRLNINKGIEFDLDLGRFDAIRTSFVVSGAWINSQSILDDYYILKRSIAGKDPTKVGVFDKGRGDENERISSTIRVIHNIPEFRFVVTFSAQTIWQESNKRVGYDSIPVAYISRGTSDVVWLSEGQKAGIQSNDQELFMNLAQQTFITERWDPLWLFNLRLTKEISKNVGFSFYANNVFAHRPLVENSRFKNQFELRNPVLFFGTEINIKL